MFVSVVVATRNRADILRKTLETLLIPANLSEGGWEVIVANNGSTDSTLELCKELGHLYPQQVRHVLEPVPGKSRALNAGVAEAKGEIAAFIDDDVSLRRDYLAQVRVGFRTYNADGVQGRVVPKCDGSPPRWFGSYCLETFTMDHGDKVHGHSAGFNGSNMAVRREILKELGGFRVELGPGSGNFLGEDAELPLRMRMAGYDKLLYMPDLVAEHRIPVVRLTKRNMRRRFLEMGRYYGYKTADSTPMLRFTAYAAKQSIRSVSTILRRYAGGRPDLAMQAEGEALIRIGTALQTWSAAMGGLRAETSWKRITPTSR